jgi:hypothetical protein
VPNDETADRSSDPEHIELLQRAADVKRKSEDLVRQLMELASRIAEAKAIAADADASRRRK